MKESTHEDSQAPIDMSSQGSPKKVKLALDQNLLPTVEDFDVYRIVFELFDRDNSGYIEA